MDKRVEIHGTSRGDMNGKTGVAIDVHLDPGTTTGFAFTSSRDEVAAHSERLSWRYTVELDGGEKFKLKPGNVRAAR